MKTGNISFDKGYETSGQGLDETCQAGAKKVMKHISLNKIQS